MFLDSWIEFRYPKLTDIRMRNSTADSMVGSDLESSGVISVLRLLIGTMAITGNMLIILIFIKFPRFRRVQSNVLISLLAISGFAVGLGIVGRTFHNIFMPDEVCDRRHCITIAQPQVIGLVFGQILILALAMDRYSAVRWPCHYLQINVKARVSVVLLVCTVIATFFILLSFHDISKEPCNQCTFGAATTKLYHALWLGFGAINAVFVIGLYLKSVLLLNTQLNSKCNKHMHTLKVHQHAFISISLVVLCYFLFWCIPVFCSIWAYLIDADETVRGYMSIAFGLGEGLNSSLTVFIYLMKHQEVRQSTRKLVFGQGIHRQSITGTFTPRKSTVPQPT